MAAMRNVTPGAGEPTDLESMERAYRKSFWTIIGHTVFLVLCCTAAILVRRVFKMPPALLTVVFVVALVLFGGDFWRFLACRRRLRQMREENLN